MSAATIAISPTKLVYGAKELKIFIQKNTYRSFLYALSFIALLLLIFCIVSYFQQRALTLKIIPLIKPISLSDLPPPPTSDAPPPPPPSATVTAPAVAGTPVPVPETMLTPDMKEFANLEDLSRSTSAISDGQIGDVKIDEGTYVVKEQEPAHDEFISTEKDPATDIGDLQKKVVYPEIARRAGIEGKVLIRVLIGKDGRPKRYIIDQAVNQSLDDAAAKAVMASVFTPAIQNGTPIDCWVTVPVQFRIR